MTQQEYIKKKENIYTSSASAKEKQKALLDLEKRLYKYQDVGNALVQSSDKIEID